MLLTGEARCMSLAQEFLTYRVYVHQRVHFKNLEGTLQVINLNNFWRWISVADYQGISTQSLNHMHVGSCVISLFSSLDHIVRSI